MKDKPEDYECRNQSELVCPYCGYEHHDSWEIGDDQDSSECNECGKKFGFEQEVTRTFSTYETCQPGDEHKFNEWEQYLGERWTRYCKICSAREWKIVPEIKEEKNDRQECRKSN